MGLLLSILVGCIGVVELLACLRHTTHRITAINEQDTPRSSFHYDNFEDYSSHDCISSGNHSSLINITANDKFKIENLHEYSLKVRNDLRSLRHQIKGTLPDSVIQDIFSFFRLNFIYNDEFETKNMDTLTCVDPEDIFSKEIQNFVSENVGNKQLNVRFLEKTKLLSKIYDLIEKEHLSKYSKRTFFNICQQTENLLYNEIKLHNELIQTKLFEKKEKSNEQCKVRIKTVYVQTNSVKSILKDDNSPESLKLNIVFENILKDKNCKNPCVNSDRQKESVSKDENLYDESKDVENVETRKFNNAVHSPIQFYIPDTGENQAFWVIIVIFVLQK